jgi:hypothetical protein
MDCNKPELLHDTKNITDLESGAKIEEIVYKTKTISPGAD